MAYATNSDVASLFRDITFDANTAVTDSEVDSIIEEVEAEINALLYDHYVVPITGTESLKIMKTISRYKAAHVVKTILEANEQYSDKVQEIQTNLEKKAMEMLKKIIPTWDGDQWVDPILNLSDAVRKQTSPKSGSVFSAPNNVSTRQIKKGGDNW